MKNSEQLSEMEYNSIHGYDRSDLQRFERQMEEGGWCLYDCNISRSSSYYSMAYKRPIPLDRFGFTDEDSRRKDEVLALKLFKQWAETGYPKPDDESEHSVYRNCTHFLCMRGMLEAGIQNYSITEHGLKTLEEYEKSV